MRVLLSEGSSLTAREHLSVLGPAGVRIDVAVSNRLAISRFSRWCHRTITVPRSADDPKGYLAAIGAALRGGGYDALLPTHEQAWLFAAGRRLLPADTPLAVADIEAFDLVQGKLACCRLLDEVGLPQPRWSALATADDARRVDLPCWLKASFSTAGRGVRYVTSPGQAAHAYEELAAAGPVIAQQPATGTYAQVAGLFSRGRLVAVHTSELAGAGAGGSAAARLSVDHPQPRAHIERLGGHLGWHGGLTLDYLHQNGAPCYIEANARTVEPGNPAAAGVNLPALTIAISRGDCPPETTIVGRPGVRTHSSLALMIGAAERTGSRAAALRALAADLGRRGGLSDSREVLTPLPADPPSLIPVLVVASQLLLRPGRARAVAAAAVRDYAVPPGAADIVRACGDARGCLGGQGRVEEGGRGGAGHGGCGGVVVHPRGLPAAVVEQVQLAGQDLGLGHAGVGGQVGQQRAHPAAVSVGGLLGRVAGMGFRAGPGERAAAVVRLGEQLPLAFEHGQQALARGVVAFYRPHYALGDAGVAGLQVGADQLVLAAEGVVQRGLGHAGLLDDAVDADRVHALVVEQLVGRGQQPLARRRPDRARFLDSHNGQV